MAHAPVDEADALLERPGQDDSVAYSLRISRDLNSLLTELARETHSTKGDVLRRALVLMEVAVDAKRRGRKVGFAREDQELEQEITGLGV